MWWDSGNAQPLLLAPGHIFVLPLRPQPQGTSALSHRPQCPAVLKPATLGYMSPSRSPAEDK